MTEKNLTWKQNALKRGGAALLACGAAAGVLSTGGTLAGWHAEKSISQETIRTGELTLSEDSSAWSLNGAPIAEADLASTPLVPGDVLRYDGVWTPTITGAMSADLKLGSDVTTGLAAEDAVTIDWAVDGTQSTQTLTEADSGIQHAVSWQLAMAPVGDPVFVTGQEAMLQSLDLSQVKLELTQK